MWFFCSYLCFLEGEKFRCEKKSVSERNVLFTCGILKQFFHVFWLRGLVIICSICRLVLVEVSGISYEYANSEVFHVFWCFLG